MVSASQKRKSLFDFPGSAGATGFGRMGTYTAASTCARTSAVTGGYNQELNSFLCDMRATQAADAARYGDKLFTPNSAARQRGVELAWRYEKKSILMGGKGSENWTAAERREIVETGSLRGSQGHHQRNVALHPEDQANPHNIKFYRSQREHLQNGHKGSWSNESDAPMINRDKMLTRTNARRVFRNEVRGIGLTAAIGLGIGFSIGFAATLAQSGISVGTIQDALKGGLQGGLTAAGLSVTGYALSRTLGQVASCAVVGALENAGVAVTTQLAQAVSAGVMGGPDNCRVCRVSVRHSETAGNGDKAGPHQYSKASAGIRCHPRGRYRHPVHRWEQGCRCRYDWPWPGNGVQRPD